mgnify:CR=1 FL=1
MKTTLLFLSVFSISSFFGQIVFVDNYDGVYSYGNESWSFDMNSDGVDDFVFRQVGSGPYNLFEAIGGSKIQANNASDDLTVDCSSDTIGLFTSFWNDKGYLWYPPAQFDIGVGNYKQAVRMIATNPANDQDGFLFGYIDYTKLETQDVIIHGWYYESSFNQSIIVGEQPTLGINELNTTKNLIRILDLMGRETSFKPNTPLIYVYDDGSIEKVFSVEY